MAELFPTRLGVSEFTGNFKLLLISCDLETSSDNMKVPGKQIACKNIVSCVGNNTLTGMSKDFQTMQINYEGLEIFIESFDKNGKPATKIVGVCIEMCLIVAL